MEKNKEIKCLVLGGSYFIGKAFLDALEKNNLFTLYVANRGTKETRKNKKIHHLLLDRDESKSCEILSNYDFDVVVDFSCWSLDMLDNVIPFLKNPYYVFISSGYAESTLDSNHPDYEYGLQKQRCETCVQKNFTESLIIRPGYVLGEEDYTNRFYKHNELDLYFYNDTTDIVMPYIDVRVLASSLINLIKHKETGLLKMGYL